MDRQLREPNEVLMSLQGDVERALDYVAIKWREDLDRELKQFLIEQLITDLQSAIEHAKQPYKLLRIDEKC